MSDNADGPEMSAAELVAMAQQVVDEVKALRGELASRRSLRRAWGVVAFDVALSLAGLGLVLGQFHANDQIRESLRQNYVTAQQQAQTRVRVLCPLYTVLLGAAEDPGRVAALSPSQKATFDANVRVIKDGYATLGCTPAATGP